MAVRRFAFVVLLLCTLVVTRQADAGGAPTPQLKITAASFDAATETLDIYGVNFGDSRGVARSTGFRCQSRRGPIRRSTRCCRARREVDRIC
jgi:hypothetical protein